MRLSPDRLDLIRILVVSCCRKALPARGTGATNFHNETVIHAFAFFGGFANRRRQGPRSITKIETA